MSEAEPKPAAKPGRSLVNRRGRVPCLDAERQAEVCAVIAQGLTVQTAADFVGIGQTTIYRTARKNPEFAAALVRARSRHEYILVRSVKDAAVERKDWRAAAWLLAHTFRDRYYVRQPRGLPVEQVRLLFERFSEALLSEVRNTEDRRRVMTRLQKISDDVSDAAGVNQRLGHET
jgi:hypothetical protein